MNFDEAPNLHSIGQGGDGCVSLLLTLPAGWPDGGDGGKGGDVVVVANHRSTLLDFRYRAHRAENGVQGGSADVRALWQLLIRVPVGTSLRTTSPASPRVDHGGRDSSLRAEVRRAATCTSRARRTRRPLQKAAAVELRLSFARTPRRRRPRRFQTRASPLMGRLSNARRRWPSIRHSFESRPRAEQSRSPSSSPTSGADRAHPLVRASATGFSSTSRVSR